MVSGPNSGIRPKCDKAVYRSLFTDRGLMEVDHLASRLPLWLRPPLPPEIFEERVSTSAILVFVPVLCSQIQEREYTGLDQLNDIVTRHYSPKPFHPIFYLFLSAEQSSLLTFTHKRGAVCTEKGQRRIIGKPGKSMDTRCEITSYNSYSSNVHTVISARLFIVGA